MFMRRSPSSALRALAGRLAGGRRRGPRRRLQRCRQAAARRQDRRRHCQGRPVPGQQPARSADALSEGTAQVAAGQTEEAIATFTLLTEDYPELPEPYNNLAVIYAGQNRLDQARNALEMAVRNNPNYAVAHENLGDIYTRLAQQSYTRSQGRATPPQAQAVHTGRCAAARSQVIPLAGGQPPPTD
jgi:tetratricopeptide (TPR) repeat protein